MFQLYFQRKLLGRTLALRPGESRFQSQLCHSGACGLLEHTACVRQQLVVVMVRVVVNYSVMCCARSLQSCPALCDPVDYSSPGSSVHEIIQARTLEWVAMPPPGDLPDPGMELTSLMSPVSAGGFIKISTTCEAHCFWRHLLFHNMLCPF